MCGRAGDGGSPMGLLGKRILVTRSEEQAGAFAARVRERGGVPLLFPTVRLVPHEDSRDLDEALARVEAFDWILFTSANAVRFFAVLSARAAFPGFPGGVRVGSVGPATTRELALRGFPAHLTAEVHTGEGLVAALAREGIEGRHFLLLRALEGRETIPQEIARRGGRVEVVPVYRNALPPPDETAAGEIGEHPPDVCTFASPSAFRNFFALLGEERAASVLSRSRLAVIGEVTARAVRERRYRVDIMPRRFTMDGLLEAIETHFASSTHGGDTR